jgi:hypothetical protein
MPNSIKYSITPETQVLRSGNFYIGVGNIETGPTYWTGISPPVSGYTIYLNKESNGPSIFAPTDDNGLITITNQIGGTSFTSATECFNWYNTQSDKMVVNKNYPSIVTSGLVLNLDASFRPSYSGSGTTWYDVSVSANTSTLANGPTYNSGGWIVFDGVDDKCTIDSKPERTTGIRLGPGTTPWMVNVLIRTTASGSNSIGTFPVLSNQSGGPVYSNLGLGTGGVMKYAHYNNAWIIETGTTVVNTGKWVFLSWVNKNDSTLDMYVNGVFDKNVSSNISGSNVNAVDSIGYSWAGYLKSDISSLTISTRSTLYTSTDVLQNYYQGNIVTSGLVLYLDAANLVSYPQSGTSWYDISSSGNTGTLVNGPTFNSSYGGSIFFDGTNDYGSTTAFSLSNSNNQISFEFWIKTISPLTSVQTIYSDAAQSNTIGYIFFYYNSDGTITYQFARTTTRSQVSATIFSSGFVDTWVNVVITTDYISKEIKFYRNNVLISTQTMTDAQFPSASRVKYIGSYSSGSGFGKMNIGSMRIYTSVLTASEIQQNYNATKSRFGL